MPIITHPPSALRQARILVAEDEPVIALDLASAVEEAGGRVVGPAASVKQALRLVANDGICAAILDVDLIDGDVGPVIEELMRRSIPVIIHSGAGLPAALLARYRNVEIHQKPTPAEFLVSRLAGRLAH